MFVGVLGSFILGQGDERIATDRLWFVLCQQPVAAVYPSKGLVGVGGGGGVSRVGPVTCSPVSNQDVIFTRRSTS